ncbi:MAG: MFS transporter [Anaerolineae bacterium]
MRPWQRNLYPLWIAQFVAIAGLSVVIPFLPYYVQELGAEQVELWSGLLLASIGVTMGIFSPVWGSLADRYGRKLMLARALFGGALLLGAMGFVRNVQQLLVLCLLLGCLGGAVPAATPLVVSSAPRQQAGQALGLMQMAVFAGASVGPLLGGPAADRFGYPTTFVVTGGLQFLAGMLVVVFVREEFRPLHHQTEIQRGDFWLGIGFVFRSREMLAVMGLELMLRLGARIMGPVLPLFVQMLVASEVGVASLVGIITGLTAATSAVGAVLLGRASDRFGYRPMLLACALVMTVVYIPQFFVTTPLQLLILQAAGGAAMGGGLAAIGALLADLSPEGRQGAIYGLDATAVSVANTLAPMIGAVVAVGLGLRAPFLFAAGVYGLATLLILWAIPGRRPERAELPRI